jgi:hypothetical protein
MGDAVLLGPLVAAAGTDPQAHGGRLQARHGLHHDAQAVGQGVQLDTHAKTPSSISASIAPRSLSTRVTRSGRSIKVGHARRQGGADAGGGLHRVGEFRGMRGGQRDERRRPGEALRHMDADRGMGAQKLPHPLAGPRDHGEVSASDARPEANRSRKASSAPWQMWKPPAFNSSISCATALPSRP